MCIKGDILQKYKVGHHGSFGSCWMLHVGDILYIEFKC